MSNETAETNEELPPLTDSGSTADLVEMGVTFEEVCDAQRGRGSEVSISTDLLFELLAAPGNRFVLTYLLRSESEISFGDLVEYVVSCAETPGDMTDGKFRGKVATRLVHSNLPKLADAGLIEYDSDEQVVRTTPVTDDVAPYLALAVARRG
jgi:hypothetical protein